MPPTTPPLPGTLSLLLLSLLLAPLTTATSPQCLTTHPHGTPLRPPPSCALPIDDSVPPSAPTRYSPWTAPPVCEPATTPRTKYCVYTNSRHGARGMALITKPETAANLGHVALDFSIPLPTNATAAAWAIVDVPGRGKGVVATRAIRKWETFMVDYAAVMVDVEFAVDVEARRGYRLLARAVDGLGDPGSVRGLGMSSGLARDPLENVLRTNAFRARVGGEEHMAVYTVVSVSFWERGSIMLVGRSDAFLRFYPGMGHIVEVAASRDIRPGEEITHSYIPFGQVSSERKKNLKGWGFTCTCDLCTAPADEIAASDERREKIAALKQQAIEAFQAGKVYMSLKLTREILPLLPEENMFQEMSDQYENMARIYYVMRDRKNAAKWARKSLGVLVEMGYLKGVREEDVVNMFARFEDDEGGRY
ncbi:hypothetical protein QBC39DRAFT_311182 [Podospora conica]|nr:hypothetical protein QBC39DRAFT_311182 [Schizothecium conicum]